MYQFLDGNMMVQFLLVFVAVVIVFAGFISWFMDFERDKAYNYHSRQAQKFAKDLYDAKQVIAIVENAVPNMEKRIEELKERNNKVRGEGHLACIKHREDIDNIAKTLGIRIKLKGWIGKTDAGKMASILKKIGK